MKRIHLGFLLSYDYEKLKQSLPPVYKEADAIFLAVDKDFRTWTGNSFHIDDSFFEWLKDFDVDHKITIYKNDFYVSELSAIQNETRERHLLSLKMGIGNWLVQVDADEIFIDFEKFVKTLRKHDHYLDNPKKQPIQISGFLINIYKFLDNGILYVKQPTKVFLATNYPNYKVGRKTKERIIYVNNVLLHECLSRSEAELKFKFENWGHSDQLNSGFFDKWKKADETNYQTIKNTFYLNAELWKDLGYFNTKNFSEIKDFINGDPKLKPSKSFLFKKNFGQWFKHLRIFKPNATKDFESK